MILLLAGLAASVAPAASIAEAARALDAGRPEQARAMIGMAVAEGASGPAVDRLLADLAFTEQQWDAAVVRYQGLLIGAPDDPRLLERGGIALIHLGRLDEAAVLLDRATATGKAGWRAHNARGVVADRRRDWDTADKAYAAALALAPASGTVLNNQGWSLLLRGRWQDAAATLAKAHAVAPDDVRIAANNDLARAAVQAALPERRKGETGAAYAARLNDAGVVALSQSNQRKAIAAFAQALEVSDSWFERAANNLALAESQRRD